MTVHETYIATHMCVVSLTCDRLAQRLLHKIGFHQNSAWLWGMVVELQVINGNVDQALQVLDAALRLPLNNGVAILKQVLTNSILSSVCCPRARVCVCVCVCVCVFVMHLSICATLAQHHNQPFVLCTGCAIVGLEMASMAASVMATAAHLFTKQQHQILVR
jgi:hypothetical protein